MRYMMMLVAVAGLMLPTLSMTGCNAVKGVGKDIHDASQNVQTWMESSDENRERLSDSTVPQR
ncbi:MAG: entericidin [Planctomycetota bacterium]|nr:entericidin [Planctomycetota bacterium]